MTAPLADDSALLTELRGLVERGHYREAADRLAALPRATVGQRTPFALLAAEAHGRLGEHVMADAWAEAALETALTRGDAHAEVLALNYRGIIAVERGDVERGEQWFAAALERCRDAPDVVVQARCLNNLGVLANLRGDPPAALASYQLAIAAYQQAGSIRGMAETHHNIGISRRDLGDYRGALAAADEAVRLATRLGDESLIAKALAGRAEVHLAMEDTAFASAEIARARDTYERVRNPVGLAEAWRLEAAVARARGDLRAAVDRLVPAAALAREQGSAHTLAEIERDLGAALAGLGDAAGANAARTRALALYRGLGAVRAAAELAALLPT